jgi:hypothetical protein
LNAEIAEHAEKSDSIGFHGGLRDPCIENLCLSEWSLQDRSREPRLPGRFNAEIAWGLNAEIAEHAEKSDSIGFGCGLRDLCVENPCLFEWRLHVTRCALRSPRFDVTLGVLGLLRDRGSGLAIVNRQSSLVL